MAWEWERNQLSEEYLVLAEGKTRNFHLQVTQVTEDRDAQKQLWGRDEENEWTMAERNRWWAKEKLQLPKTLTQSLCPGRFMAPVALMTFSSCCSPTPSSPATAAPGLQTSISPISKYQTKLRSNSSCLYFPNIHRRKRYSSSCKQNGLLLPQCFLHKCCDFRAIAASLPSLTAQVLLVQAHQHFPPSGMHELWGLEV